MANSEAKWRKEDPAGYAAYRERAREHDAVNHRYSNLQVALAVAAVVALVAYLGYQWGKHLMVG